MKEIQSFIESLQKHEPITMKGEDAFTCMVFHTLLKRHTSKDHGVTLRDYDEVIKQEIEKEE